MKTILVCGQTRSGLTATMQMLSAGGYPCNGKYPAFEQNNNQVLPGMANKLVDTQHCFPKTGDYHVILLNRNIDEQVKSYAKFAKLVCQIPVRKSELPAYKKSFKDGYQIIQKWAARQSGCLKLDFERLINDPLGCALLMDDFCGCRLDTDKMEAAIIHRSPNCYDGMLELEMIKNI